MLQDTIVSNIIEACNSVAPPAKLHSMIRGVKFASIPVTDQDRAIAFYTEKLGFRLVTDQPFTDEQRWIELGIPGADTRVVLFRFDDSLKPGGQMNITFWSDDVEEIGRGSCRGRGEIS